MNARGQDIGRYVFDVDSGRLSGVVVTLRPPAHYFGVDRVFLVPRIRDGELLVVLAVLVLWIRGRLVVLLVLVLLLLLLVVLLVLKMLFFRVVLLLPLVRRRRRRRRQRLKGSPRHVPIVVRRVMWPRSDEVLLAVGVGHVGIEARKMVRQWRGFQLL